MKLYVRHGEMAQLERGQAYECCFVFMQLGSACLCICALFLVN